MFNQDKKKPTVVNKLGSMERNVIAKNTTIVGEIKSDGDFRIDGVLEGNLKTNGKVIIGSGGFVKGNIQALNADIEGKISGALEVDKILTVKASADISGDVTVGKLSIEPGATFNASCAMKVVKKEEANNNEKKLQFTRNKGDQKKTFK
jgi:cytoskeletal protein CcmA (bactofilin family)